MNSEADNKKRSISTLSKSEAISSEAMVVTKHPSATEAGLEILRAGGNAMDAAIASCFATGVVIQLRLAEEAILFTRCKIKAV